jgi:hypothetical protein
MANER